MTKLTIKVEGNNSTMNQANWQSVKRCAEVLRLHGFEVEIEWEEPARVELLKAV